MSGLEKQPQPALTAGSQLAASLAVVRQRIPLPHEVLAPADSEEKDRLAIIVETTPLGGPIIDLAHQLTSRDLRLVFPLLSEPLREETRSGQVRDKLYLIIRERACPSLYRFGWAIYQQTFYSLPVARGLAILCAILEIKQDSSARQAPAGQLKRKDRRRLPLISYLAAPDARHFTEQLLKSMGRLKVPLERFMKQYQINPELPLGAALIGQCFISGDAGLFAGSHRQFQQALAHAGHDMQADLIRRLFSMKELDPETANLYFQVVYRLFGDPGSHHPIWSRVRKKDIATFHLWIMAATIGSQCQKNTAKARLYLRYTDLLLDVERWDDQTIILHFPGFMIVDDRRQPLFALYYEQNDPQTLPFDSLQSSQEESHPASSAIPHRRVEDAISRASTIGPVGLLFDDEGIHSSASFLDFVLYQKKAVSRSQLKNLTPL